MLTAGRLSGLFLVVYWLSRVLFNIPFLLETKQQSPGCMDNEYPDTTK